MNPSPGDPDTSTRDRRPSGIARLLSRTRRPFKRLSFSRPVAAESAQAQPLGHVPPSATNVPAQIATSSATDDRQAKATTLPSSQTGPGQISSQKLVAAQDPDDEDGPIAIPSVSQIRVTRHVKRLCHRCGISFSRAERTCQGCRHALCSRCPRDPPRAALTACIRADQSSESGGDQPDSRHRIYERTLKKPRYRIRYTCDQCAQLFPEKRKVCNVCGHQLCEKCTRDPPRRSPKPQHSADAMSKLQARLDAVSVPPRQES